ncbi:MAG: DUF951 domain-containing protein [Bacillota bacterium]
MSTRPVFRIGDQVRLKKAHPCGSDRWEITRVGMDFGLRCLGCHHWIMIPRTKFERVVREHWPAEKNKE